MPFALLFALLRLGDPLGLAVLAAALGVRMTTEVVSLKWAFRDPEGLRYLALLPLRDVLGLAVWALAITKRTVIWREAQFAVKESGRMTRLGTVSWGRPLDGRIGKDAG